MENGLELRRQLFHLCVGLLILVLLLFSILDVKIMLVVFFVGLVLSVVSLKYDIPFIRWFLDRFERGDSFPGKGALFFFLGSILVLILFPKNVALASIAILTFGDSIGPLVGAYFGKKRSKLNGRRFVEGFVVAFFVSFVAASFFVQWYAALVGSFFALGFEFLEFRFRGFSVDDNLLIPLIAGAMIYVVMAVSGAL
jgi:dolichol kinase